MRYAVYFTPAASHPLTEAGAAFLGRDAFTGAARSQPAIAGLSPADVAAATADPRRYGFHATLKAPFACRPGVSEGEILSAFHRFAAGCTAFQAPLSVSTLDGFLALTPAVPAPALSALAADCVVAFDRFRAPPPEGELARRRAAGLDAAGEANLLAWGYPYVFGQFRFHMTLTGRLSGPPAEAFAAAARRHFDALLVAPVAIDTLALFVEPSPGAPFTVRATAPLSAG